MAKIAILSDSHDNIWNLERALAQIGDSQAAMLLHCGDLVAPFALDQMAHSFTGPIHIIFGNNDGDGRLLQTISAQHGHVTLHGIYAEVSFSQRVVAMIHYPEPARRIAQSGQFHLVCYGHDHTAHMERIGDCYLVNPGQILGRLGPATWGLYDCATHTYEQVYVDG